MTPREHNKLLAWSHFVVGAMNGFGMLIGVLLVLLGVFVPSGGRSGEFDSFTTLTVGWIVFFLSAGVALISFVAGSKMLKRDESARVWAFISAVIAGPNAPLGTAVCVYTFWFFLGDAGKAAYRNTAASIANSPDQLNKGVDDAWTTQNRGASEYEYVPPSQPPNWRSDD